MTTGQQINFVHNILHNPAEDQLIISSHERKQMSPKLWIFCDLMTDKIDVPEVLNLVKQVFILWNLN